MRIILLIIDGLGDKPIPQLGNKTPLEVARTPNLDYLAKKGICGLVEPFFFPWQKNPRSATSHLALFGYNPRIYYLGRGPYEAAGIGMKMKKGDVILRANFGTVDGNLKIVDRRAGRISNTKSLVEALSGIKIRGVKFLMGNSLGHRAVLILRGKNISEKIGGGDIKKAGIKAKKIIPLEKSKKAEFTAEVLNKFLEKAYRVLGTHPLNKKRKKQGLLPANYLLVRGAGKLKKTPNFYQKYKLKAACVAAGDVYKGVAKILGMDLIKVKGATGYINTNLRGKFLAV
ncbi:MAG: phosphoglycerate mutase, partial [Candidatus Paceibacterales bacterium]